MKNPLIILLIAATALLWGCDQYYLGRPDLLIGDDEIGRVVAPAAYGGYLVAAQKFPAGSDVADLYFVFLSEDGHVEWDAGYPTNSHNEPLAARETQDQGFLILYQRSYYSGTPSVYLMKLDHDGHVLWDQSIDTGDLNHIVDVEPTDDGGFALLGSSGAYGQVTLTKISRMGDVSFGAAYGDGMSAADVQEITGGYMILANVSRNSESSTVELIRTDSWGEPRWSTQVWSDGPWTGERIAPDGDGGFFIVGENASGASSPLLIKVDGYGRWLWREDYAQASGAAISASASDWNGTLLAGELTYDRGDRDGFAMFAGRDGYWRWSRSFGGSNTDRILDAVPSNGGGYVLCGSSASFNETGDSDVYVLKISTDGALIWQTTVGE